METPPAEGPVRWQRQEARRGGTKGRMAEPGTRQHQTALQAAPDRLELLFGQMTDCREGESGGGTPARIRVSTARPGGSSSSTPGAPRTGQESAAPRTQHWGPPRSPGAGQESAAPRTQHWGPPRTPRDGVGVHSPEDPALGTSQNPWDGAGVCSREGPALGTSQNPRDGAGVSSPEGPALGTSQNPRGGAGVSSPKGPALGAFQTPSLPPKPPALHRALGVGRRFCSGFSVALPAAPGGTAPLSEDPGRLSAWATEEPRGFPLHQVAS